MYAETIETKVVTEETLDNMLAESAAPENLKSILKNTITMSGLPMSVEEFKDLLHKFLEKLEKE